jgi:REP-associated tyrosine transposase
MAKPSRPSDPQDSKAEFRTFFLTTRTAESKPILQTDRMAALFVDVLRSYMRAGKFRVHEFVIMPNHVHLLVSVGADMSIEKAMQLIKGNFSFRAKAELGLQGEIWQRGFSDVRIKTERVFVPINCTSTTIRSRQGWRAFLRNTRMVRCTCEG